MTKLLVAFRNFVIAPKMAESQGFAHPSWSLFSDLFRVKYEYKSAAFLSFMFSSTDLTENNGDTTFTQSPMCTVTMAGRLVYTSVAFQFLDVIWNVVPNNFTLRVEFN